MHVYLQILPFHLPHTIRLVPHHCCSVDKELAGSGQQDLQMMKLVMKKGRHKYLRLRDLILLPQVLIGSFNRHF